MEAVFYLWRDDDWHFFKKLFSMEILQDTYTSFLPNSQDHAQTLLFLHFSFSLHPTNLFYLYVFFSLSSLWVYCCLLCFACSPFLISLAKSCYSSQSQLQYDFIHPLLSLNSIYQVSLGTKVWCRCWEWAWKLTIKWNKPVITNSVKVPWRQNIR